MIEIKDNDLPVMVAAKIIAGTKPYVATPLTKVIIKAITENDGDSVMVDMFSRDEIKEIADYLMVYYHAHKAEETDGRYDKQTSGD